MCVCWSEREAERGEADIKSTNCPRSVGHVNIVYLLEVGFEPAIPVLIVGNVLKIQEIKWRLQTKLLIHRYLKNGKEGGEKIRADSRVCDSGTRGA